MPITFKTRIVTPDDARAMLAGNTDNRTLREGWVDQLAGLIKAGKWAITHQGIAIAKGGRLLDGQHRLHAIVRAGIPVEIMVATGLDDDSYRWIDGGKTRTTPDRIHLVDDSHVNRLCCSLVNNYLRYAKGANTPSVDDIETQFLHMVDSFVYVGSSFARPIKLLTLMPVGAAFVCYHHHFQANAVEAVESFITGKMLDEGDPILALREALLAQRVRGQSEQYWKSIGCLFAHREGRRIRSVIPATADFAGNTYDRLRWERTAIGLKGGLTRKIKARMGAK